MEYPTGTKEDVLRSIILPLTLDWIEQALYL